jgi:hypothetical protein
MANVSGAQKWVGRSRWNYGSFHFWGDVPALMPMISKGSGTKVPGLDWSKHGQPGYAEGPGKCFRDSALKVPTEDEGRRTDPGKDARFTSRDCGDEIKCGGDWFNGESPSQMRHHNSRSSKRKMASAMIAKIPFALSHWIGSTYLPLEVGSEMQR